MTGRDKMTCKMTCTQLAEAIAVPAATIGFCYEEVREEADRGLVSPSQVCQYKTAKMMIVVQSSRGDRSGGLRRLLVSGRSLLSVFVGLVGAWACLLLATGKYEKGKKGNSSEFLCFQGILYSCSCVSNVYFVMTRNGDLAPA